MADGVEAVGDGDGRDEDDAGGVVVVVVVVPEGAREHLEDVEGREDLAEEHDEDGRQVDADRVLAEQFAAVWVQVEGVGIRVGGV